jgi:hypothetical protein
LDYDELGRLNERLAAATEHQARVQRLQHRVTQLEEERRHCAAEAERLRSQVEKEDGDVDRLEGLSLTGLFLAVLGSKEERLQQERQEALAARLKHEEAAQRLEALDREWSQASLELNNQRPRGAEYETLLQEKEHLIARDTGRGAAELVRLGEQGAQIKWQQQQLDEARAAGLRADSALAQVEESLESAAGWGTWDMFGGGMLATHMKHERMDEARSQVHHAQQALAAFQRELKDVSLSIGVGVVEVDGFSRFADYFFDGLIADWAVQNRINESLDSVCRARSQVANLLAHVSGQMGSTQTQLKELDRQREIFIQQYQG